MLNIIVFLLLKKAKKMQPLTWPRKPLYCGRDKSLRHKTEVKFLKAGVASC